MAFEVVAAEDRPDLQKVYPSDTPHLAYSAGRVGTFVVLVYRLATAL